MLQTAFLPEVMRGTRVMKKRSEEPERPAMAAVVRELSSTVIVCLEPCPLGDGGGDEGGC